MASLQLSSPCKINLFLAITGKRSDGFHALVSLVAPLEFGDRLRLSLDEDLSGVSLSCSDASLPRGEKNLAYRAASLFRERFGLKAGVRIELEKRVPSGAGLGGGSSNAATVLSGLAQLSGLGAEADLFDLAARLGSDCPLFLDARPCIMRGRGERIEALPAAARERLRGLPVLLCKPSFPIATASAYARLAEQGRYDGEAWAEERLRAWLAGDMSLAELLSNSFEQALFRKYIGLSELVRRLRERHGLSALMSGSGSSCFVLGEDDDQLAKAEAEIRDAWGETAFARRTRIL